MNYAVIGRRFDTSGKLYVDIDKVVESRILVQASSGGGKSYLIRKLLEECFGKVQIIVLDYEDDFSTLREKYDFVLFGEDRDYPVNVRYAEKMATTLLELNISAIISVYDLTPINRATFVKKFLDAMINAKRELWHPCIVVIDEAHIFAPEKGQSIAKDAVNSLLTRGRKRGYCGVLATQRLAKLDKDSAAECKNKFVGSCVLDVDRKRAGEELGFTKSEDVLSLRDLEPGEFFCFGPAINKQVTKIKVDKVKTSHISHSNFGKSVLPPPSKRIKEVLKEITNIPKEAEKEFQTIEDLRSEIIRLKRELAQKPKTVENKVVVDNKKVQEITARYNSIYKNYTELQRSLKNNSVLMLRAFEKEKSRLLKEIMQLFKTSTLEVEQLSVKDIEKFVKIVEETKSKVPDIVVPVNKNVFSADTVNLKKKAVSVGEYDVTTLKKCPREIATFLYQRMDKAYSKTQIAVFTNYSKRSSGFINALSTLRVQNLIVTDNEGIRWNDNIVLVGVDNNIVFSRNAWVEKLKKCPRSIYEFLLNNEGDSFTREYIADVTGYSVGSSGFINAVSLLNTLGLIEKTEGGVIKLNSELTEV